MTNRWRGGAVLIIYFVVALVAVGKSFFPSSSRGDKDKPSGKDGKIAVVDFYGPLSFSMNSYEGSDLDEAVENLRDLRKQDDVKGVVLRINSPGGSVAAVQEVHQEIVALKKAGKIVVASFGDVAASGGYYIAAPANKIVANPGTLTGSIGVIFELGNVQELFKKVGVKMETVKSGALKDAGSPFRPLSPREKAYFQALVDDAYSQFVQAVSEGRAMKPEKLKLLADGRVFTGMQAKDNGLIDELGNYQTALDLARKLAGVDEDEEPLTYSRSPLEKIMRLLNSSARVSVLPLRVPDRRVRFEYVWE